MGLSLLSYKNHFFKIKIMKIKYLTCLERDAHIFHEKLIGCSEEELSFFRKLFNNKLPVAFEEFLYLAGHNFWHQVDEISFNFSLENYKMMQENLVREFKAKGQGVYKKNEVLLTGTDYTFVFIRNSEGEDPPVYRSSDHPEHFLLSNNFSSFILVSVEYYKKSYNIKS